MQNGQIAQLPLIGSRRSRTYIHFQYVDTADRTPVKKQKALPKQGLKKAAAVKWYCIMARLNIPLFAH
jgi:hypothetical protein